MTDIRKQRGIQTNATSSVRAAVRNLSHVEPAVTIPGLLRAIGREFLRSDSEGRDLGQNAINQQRGFTLVNPTDDWFPGLEKIREEYSSWTWRFGKTPDFTVTREFPVPRELSVQGAGKLQVQMRVSKGKMQAVTLTIPPGFVSGAPEGEVSVISGLEGQEFSERVVSKVEEAFANKDKSSEKKRFIAECVRRVVQ
ncbi:hypothetical protein B566_EDAN003497 [Ephemera danica]|nr:hypothetical protein B566_EDAN003497 [Ephemera danica]